MSHKNQDGSFPREEYFNTFSSLEQFEMNEVNSRLLDSVDRLHTAGFYGHFVPGYAPDEKIAQREKLKRELGKRPIVDTLSRYLDGSVSQDMGFYSYDPGDGENPRELIMMAIDIMSTGRTDMNRIGKELIIGWINKILNPEKYSEIVIESGSPKDKTCAAIVRMRSLGLETGMNEVEIWTSGDCSVAALWENNRGQHLIGHLTKENNLAQKYQLMDLSFNYFYDPSRSNLQTFFSSGNRLDGKYQGFDEDGNLQEKNVWEYRHLILPDYMTVIAFSDGYGSSSDDGINPLDGFLYSYDPNKKFYKISEIDLETHSLIMSYQMDELNGKYKKKIIDDRILVSSAKFPLTPTPSQ